MIGYLKKFTYTNEELISQIRRGDKSILSVIAHLDMNKKYEIKNERPTTLLFYSVTGMFDSGGYSNQIVEKMISCGANLNRMENYNKQQKEQTGVFYYGTPLQAAIKSFRPDLAVTLLEHGSIPSQCFYNFIKSINFKMDTNDIYRCAELMLLRGAEPNEFSKDEIHNFGETALDILLFRSTCKVDQFNSEALINCYRELIKLLKSHKAQVGNGYISSVKALEHDKYEVTFKRSYSDSYTMVMKCIN
ncbi:hypothetical protein WNY51_13985 [Pseudocolwellia sp. AS88]|uniref:hypothetical protein n=1 Tax=Pseudocolwellia sp. AS88 TaxID=3063958 RepID=UPI0026F2C3B8|nr:hypothetical protein [Pseudocolwellia sp. AS88]MDO7084019.1 hypothetical protein [Pseudocolwellia sp. AS88]